MLYGRLKVIEADREDGAGVIAILNGERQTAIHRRIIDTKDIGRLSHVADHAIETFRKPSDETDTIVFPITGNIAGDEEFRIFDFSGHILFFIGYTIYIANLVPNSWGTLKTWPGRV